MPKDEDRLHVILRKFENFDGPAAYSKLDVVQKIGSGYALMPWTTTFKHSFGIILAAFLIFICFYMPFPTSSCFLEMPQFSSKIFRQPEYCDICENVTAIEKITNISISTFYENYIKRVRPVVVSDAATEWPALNKFNFDFFKSLYEDIDFNSNEKKRCQFFPYKTEFHSLSDVFKMEPARARLEAGEQPWYVGWSNCNDGAGRLLRKFYQKPYFLENRSENIALSWIFMGGPGHGAHMHVDDVAYPSWQAQLSGRKLWQLAPPPECYFWCSKLTVVLEPGEIIVLDTNRWYHQTRVLSDQVSVTIGSEFD